MARRTAAVFCVCERVCGCLFLLWLLLGVLCGDGGRAWGVGGLCLCVSVCARACVRAWFTAHTPAIKGTLHLCTCVCVCVRVSSFLGVWVCVRLATVTPCS